MSKLRSHPRLVAAVVLLLAGLPCAQSQTTIRTWSATPVDGDWNDTANWAGGVVPVNTDRVAFGTSSVTTLNNDLSGLTLNSTGTAATDSAIYFQSGASAYTINGNTLNLHNAFGSAGGSRLIRNDSTATQTVGANLAITTSTGQAAEILTSGDLTFNGTITVGAVLGTGGDLDVSMGSTTSRTVTFNGAVTLAAAGSSKSLILGANGSNAGGVYTFNSSINKTGSGALLVTLYSGTTNINAATGFTNTGTKTLDMLSGASTAPTAATININHANAFTELTQINLLRTTAVVNGSTGTASLLVGANTWTSNANISIGTNANIGASVVIGGKSGLGASGTATFNGNITALDSTNDNARTLTVTASEGRVNFNGAISTAAGGATVLGVTKTGAGIVSLAGANTYTGNTAVSAGTLLLNNASGSATGSTGVLTVASGARLAGFGSTASVTTIASGGRITAGNIASGSTAPTIDTVTQANNTLGFSQSLVINGVYDWYLGAASESVGFTQLDITSGSLTLGGTSSFNLSAANFVNGLNPNSADSFWTTDHSWIIADVAGATSIVGSFGSVDLGTWTNGSFALSLTGGTGNDITLSWTAAAIPEPSTYALLLGCAGLIAGAVIRRRR
ncbi:MAG: autotransporter-associated beta strand repeat protein [Rariglobus sp.]|nr:autotransporter-associated beta strand repeat protein [Rariglobus sp.]